MAKQTRQFGSRWFRVYDEAADDPKLLMLSDKLHRFLFTCWCLASKHEGYLPPVAEIAVRARKTPAAVSAMLAELHERGLLDDEADTFTPHNWSLRQYKSDVSTPRVKAFRERRRNGNETFPKPFQAVTETPPDQNRADTEQKQNRADVFVLPENGVPLQSRRAPTMAEAWSGFDFEAWFEAQYTNHPKKGHRSAAMRNLSEVREVENPEWRATFEARHEAWRKSKRWTWNGGAAAPFFDEWILDRGWQYEPPVEVSESERIWASL